jgi:hypothetical protein
VSVAIACNLSDGVVLAVDSAVTVPDPTGAGVAKVYENAQKLFQLGESPAYRGKVDDVIIVTRIDLDRKRPWVRARGVKDQPPRLCPIPVGERSSLRIDKGCFAGDENWLVRPRVQRQPILGAP